MKVFTEVNDKEIEIALAGDLMQMWNLMSTLEGDKSFMKALEKVKMGVNLNFDIRAIIEGDYEKKPAFNEIWIERNLHLNIIKFRDELDLRKKIMRDILRDLYDGGFDNQHEVEVKGFDG